MSALKYALLILPPHSADDAREVVLGDGVESFVSSLKEVVDPAQLDHWERWTGEVRWRDISCQSRFVTVTSDAQVPKVLDGENIALMDRLRPCVAALHLVCGLRRPWGKCYLVTGDAADSRSFTDLRSFEDFKPITRPFYERRSEYVRSFDWSKNPWLDEWLGATALVGRGPRAPLIAYALNSMAHAMGETALEFRIPELVRAAETVLALRRGLGAKDFAARALQIAAQLPQAKFMGGLDVLALLQEVYELRNACVHGKLPFEELAARGDAGELRVSQLEYAAEEVARAALLLALKTPGPHFGSRDVLEAAWNSGSFPPTPPSRH